MPKMGSFEHGLRRIEDRYSQEKQVQCKGRLQCLGSPQLVEVPKKLYQGLTSLQDISKDWTFPLMLAQVTFSLFQ